MLVMSNKLQKDQVHFAYFASVPALFGFFAHEYLIPYSWRRMKTFILFVKYLDEHVILLRKSTDGTFLKLILEEFSWKVSFVSPSLGFSLHHKFPTSH